MSCEKLFFFSKPSLLSRRFFFHFPGGEIEKASDKWARLNEQKVQRSGEGLGAKKREARSKFRSLPVVLEMQ